MPPGLTVLNAGVDNCPAFAIIDRPQIDVVERKR
jgi:hypothetical protein